MHRPHIGMHFLQTAANIDETTGFANHHRLGALAIDMAHLFIHHRFGHLGIHDAENPPNRSMSRIR